MGIYTNGVIYGIKLVQKNNYPNCDLDNDDSLHHSIQSKDRILNDEFITIYEKFDEHKELCKEERDKVILFYEKLENKKCIFFIYTQWSTTYDVNDDFNVLKSEQSARSAKNDDFNVLKSEQSARSARNNKPFTMWEKIDRDKFYNLFQK
jgi:hypothetical protein